MKVDNFEQFKEFMNFTNQGDFYWINVIKRRKENPSLSKSEKIIKTYNIYSKEHLFEVRDSIIEYCELNNARAYIHINKRNDKKVALRTLSLIAENIAAENYNIKRCYDSVCGQYNSDENKKWIIDIDTFELDKYKWINVCLEVITIFPTLNGYHYIVKPFNKQEHKELTNEDIHKDNATLLHYNKI